MTSPTFVSNRLAELPACLSGPEGRAWAKGVGAVQDAETPRLRAAAVSRLPRLAPDDALDALGGWLLLPRLPGEVNGDATSGYRGRLCNAFPIWGKAGSKGAIVDSLNEYGLPNVLVLNDYETGGAWAGAWYSRFRVKIGPDMGAKGWIFGSGPSAEEQREILAQILKWKWLYSYPVDVVLDYGVDGTETFYIGPLIDYGFIIDVSHIGGYETI